MLIRVMYLDSKYDMVKPIILDKQIESGNIFKFQRSSGWATLGVDPIRASRRTEHKYSGPERRRVFS